MRNLVLYIHDYCSLCETMQQQLQPLVESAHITLTVVDLDERPDLQSLYSERVPVLAHTDGRLICFGRLDPAALQQALA
jgi:hypothetical protein